MSGGSIPENAHAVFCCADSTEVGYTIDRLPGGTYADTLVECCVFVIDAEPTVAVEYQLSDSNRFVSIVDCDDPDGPNYCGNGCV